MLIVILRATTNKITKKYRVKESAKELIGIL